MAGPVAGPPAMGRCKERAGAQMIAGRERSCSCPAEACGFVIVPWPTQPDPGGWDRRVKVGQGGWGGDDEQQLTFLM